MTGLTLFSVLQLLVRISLQSQECYVNSSEYAYHKDSVDRAETASANCKNYPSGLAETTPGTIEYIHCSIGTQLRLTDSDLGPAEEYIDSYYYEWRAGSGIRQLLFIFSTRVNLTTITLHYYSDSQQGLPRLRFYAAPDDFDVWDAPPGNSRYANIAAVPPSAESAGRRNVSVNFNFSTQKILMVKTGSTYKLAVSEVEFFKQYCGGATVTTNIMRSIPTYTQGSTSNTGIEGTTKKRETTQNDHDGDFSITSTTITSQANGVSSTSESDIANLIIGVVVAILILVLLAAIALTVIIVMSRKSVKRKSNFDSSYSALNRGTPQQLQPLAVHNSSELYDQIHLSPLTGQAEFICNNETENPQSQQGIYTNIEEQPLHVLLQTAGSNEPSKNASNTEQPTYAVVNKKQKKKKHTAGKELVPDQKCEAQNEDLRNVKEHKMESKEISDMKKVSPSKEIESLEELYTVVKKKPKRSAAKEDDNIPPIPPHTVEELYTAVNKIPKVRAATKEEEAPPIPPHTVEELYTAVNKTPKGNAANDEEEAPPIPPHTEDM